jgi:exosortase/archaeosortase family protein
VARTRPKPAREPAAAPRFDRLRFAWTALSYLVLVGLFSLFLLTDYVFEDLLAGFREAVAAVAGATYSALGFPISASGALILGPGTSLRIVDECTGVDATILVVAAVLVFPARWLPKLAGVLLAISVMMIVNFARILSLIYIGSYHPAWLEAAHLYVWPVIVIIAGVGTLLVWAERVDAAHP